MTTKNCANNPKSVLKDLCEMSFVRNVRLPVKALDSNLIVETYASLDDGSNASLCSEELATWLGLSGRSTSLTLTTMEREKSKSTSQVVSL